MEGTSSSPTIELQHLFTTSSLSCKRLAQTPGMLQLYDGVIQDQVRRGFIERVDISNTPNTGKVHYIV